MKMTFVSLLFSVLAALLCGCAVDMRKVPATIKDQDKFNNPYLDANKAVTDKKITYYVVLKTKGSHKYAQINAGKDISLRNGVKIKFIDIRRRDGKAYARVFAIGSVVSVDAKTAWVEVFDFEKAHVMENHFAAVRLDQSKTINEKVDPSKWFSLEY
ncbi:MAG: hypothetical protein A2017_21130 [Lentisphaerae bacterium GWF2_44_16]|nr:MAG: hypothetical protein A2017_21130 [Lentisphaerae bacterium GWF2_44_16]